MGDIHFQLRMKEKPQKGQSNVLEDVHSTKRMGLKKFNKFLFNKDHQMRMLNKIISEKEDELTTNENDIYELQDLNTRELVELHKSELKKRRIDLG